MSKIEKFNSLQELLLHYPKVDLGKAQDLTKITPVNNLIPICRVSNSSTRPYWACQCKICKKYKVTKGCNIKDKNSFGCCGNVQNLLGQTFGKLKVISMTERRRDRHVIWKCKCECGNICEVCSKELINGDTKSCGCIVRENSSHGQLKILQLLKENNILFETQRTIKPQDGYCKYIDFCINPNKQNMYFIEYDGKQHFLQNCHFGSGRRETEELKVIQKRDQQKNEYCQQNNIPLIRIPYTRYEELCLDDLLLDKTQWRVV